VGRGRGVKAVASTSMAENIIENITKNITWAS
jgi:hypothetical protein